MKSFILVFAFGVLVLAGSCRWWLPERFALNAPVAHLLFGVGADAPEAAAFGARIRAAGDLRVALYADELSNARMLRFTPAGDLLVSRPRAGTVELLVRDGDGDGAPDGRRTLLEGLERPHGMDFHGDWLYVAETDAVGRVRFDAAQGSVSGEFERILTGIPGGGNHWTRTLRFGPDGALYLSIGSSCNVCAEQDERRATLMRYTADGEQEEIYASGLRNAVGFDWRPETGELYATDNGRDLLGDDFPPCELNRIERGHFYGWPYFNGDNVPDPEWGHLGGKSNPVAPVHAFRAHNAPLGITFVRGADTPEALRGAALVALHGSWNRREKDGYKVVSLHWQEDGRIEERDFLWGFLEGEDVIGRPVDVAEGPDGAFYVSDDYAGAIYRVSHDGRGGAASAAPPGDAPSRSAAPADPDRVERGATLYESLGCASCHEVARAAPGVVAVELANLSARFDRDSLADFLAAPTPPMPAVDRDLDDRLALASYLLERTHSKTAR